MSSLVSDEANNAHPGTAAEQLVDRPVLMMTVTDDVVQRRLVRLRDARSPSFITGERRKAWLRAFVPDLDFLLIQDADVTRIWRASDGAELLSVHKPWMLVTMRISPDRKQVVLLEATMEEAAIENTAVAHRLRVLDVVPGQLEERALVPLPFDIRIGSGMTSDQFVDEATFIIVDAPLSLSSGASEGSPPRIFTFDIKTGAMREVMELQQGEQLVSVTLHRPSGTLVVGTENDSHDEGRVYALSLSTAEVAQREGRALADFSLLGLPRPPPEGPIVYTDKDKKVRAWMPWRPGAPSPAFTPTPDIMNFVSAGDLAVFYDSKGAELRVYRVSTGKLLRAIPLARPESVGHRRGTWMVLWISPDASYVQVGEWAGPCHSSLPSGFIVDLRTGAKVFQVDHHSYLDGGLFLGRFMTKSPERGPLRIAGFDGHGHLVDLGRLGFELTDEDGILGREWNF